MKILVLFAAVLLPAVSSLAQRASMESPIVKTSSEQVTFTAGFSSFEPEAEYRIGVGTGGASLEKATIQFETENGEALRVGLVDFKQGHTSSWFDVPEIAARGFIRSGDILSAGRRIILKFSIPRRDADAIKKIYVFVAKRYGPETWYLEHGAEVNDEHW